MVHKKSKSIKKLKSSEAHKKEKKSYKKQPEVIWPLLSVMLGLLLVVSVFTAGFRFDKLKNAEDSLKGILSKDIPEEAKANVESALSSLSRVRELIAEQSGKERYASKNKVKLDFYVMSQCPYGTQVEDAIKPVLDKLGNSVDFSLNFISTDLGGGNFQSLHGDPETKGNIVQLCAIKYNPAKYMDMIVCMNKNPGAIPNNWENCASENGLDVQKIKRCYEGDEGKALLSESIRKSNAVGASASPTILVNSQAYTGGRDTLSFMRTLCKYLEDHPECKKLPEPAEVNLIVINDKRCAECQEVDALVAQLNSLFPGLKTKTYDFSDSDGRRLFDELSLKLLPVFLFDKNIEKGEGYPNVERYLDPVGQYYSLRIGAFFDPLAEICGSGVDDDRDGLIDCDDQDCKGEWFCMEKKDRPEVELFVMSHCPYGTQMEKGILPVVELLGNKIDFKVRFVYYAMHGEVEVKEQVLQYCIQKEQPEKFLTYLKCFLDAGNTEECLTRAAIDREKAKLCIDDADTRYNISKNMEDKDSWLNGRYPIFATDYDLNMKYNVGGSPTLVINGVVAETSRDPAGLLQTVCIGFKEQPGECYEQLSSQAYTPGFGFEAAAGYANVQAGCS